ncbi:PAS domain-containing hybrid sensor histidine kinase/response regulator [Desulfobulbus alkaliphilus]|uniref:PAS domain-containing hybrid sensor histidine kinase/response regulator n=1 Tax=Desulfobulbus alkaliphilus TaxID=869814 RepID=UPI0019635607|nr:PAS domain-containing sensor histidine kinase [Desulfobulbus alkaliphilus]MBM9536316.1 PAS domain S-box protein [Desulfobulbus alkaliphilus]
MTSAKKQDKEFAALRGSMEKSLGEGGTHSSEQADASTPEEMRLTFHELAAYQLELEKQNEKLRQAQAELDDSRARYFDLYDLAPVGYCTLSGQGLILEANLTACNLLGIARDTMYSQPFIRFICEQDRDIFTLRHKPEAGSCEPDECELRMVKEDGTIFWAHLATTDGGRSRKPRECRVVLTDITERKETEAALRQSEARYREIVNTAREGIWVLDGDWLTSFVNPYITELLGYEPAEIEGRPFDHFIWPEDTDDHAQLIQERQRGLNGTYERRLRHKDGHIVWTIVSATARKDDLGRVVGSFAMLTDITARKMAEEELQQSEQKTREAQNFLQLVLDTIPVRIFWKDTNLRYLGCNRLFAEDAGCRSPQELIGRDDYSLGWHEQAESYRRDDAEIIRTGSSKVQYEEVQTTPDGRKIWLSTTKVPLRNTDGRVLGVLGTYEEISRRKQADEEIVKIQNLESLSLFAGTLAHNFSNILMVILGNISFAKMLVAPDTAAYQRLVTAESASLQAKDLTRQFLTFAQGGAPEKKSISVTETIKNYGQIALSGAQSTCEYRIDADVWPIEADESQIGQALTNILINADQSMPKGGTISVQCQNVHINAQQDLPLEHGRYVQISITDQGSGIAKEYLNKIFDPYFTTKKTGCGLGLASTYSIVKKHGGHIDVSSQPGSGTTFTLYLPASDVSTASAAPPLATTVNVLPSLSQQGTGKILIMDDHDMVGEILTNALQKYGYTVELTRDGEEALIKYAEAQQAEQPFDVVIMDLLVPGGMGGKEATQKILDLDPDAKVIVSSGYCHDPIRTDHKSYGFSAVITKPYRIEELLRQLQGLLHA